MSAHTHDHEHSAAVSNRVKGLVARLERDGFTTESDLDRIVEEFLRLSRKENAYRAVARAWVDPEYKRRLLEDGSAALAELGIDLSHWSPVRLRVVENTSQTHNVIVCTLCSCYPIALLGPSPTWYKSEAYRSRVVRDPRSILAEFGITLPPEQAVAVWDSTSEVRYMVLPQRPAGTEDLSEAELAALITRDGLIGTALL
ncbi:MAG: nitrile hydratase subunit alpha [Candidatus Aquilonibacter sp.]